MLSYKSVSNGFVAVALWFMLLPTQASAEWLDRQLTIRNHTPYVIGVNIQSITSLFWTQGRQYQQVNSDPCFKDSKGPENFWLHSGKEETFYFKADLPADTPFNMNNRCMFYKDTAHGLIVGLSIQDKLERANFLLYPIQTYPRYRGDQDDYRDRQAQYNTTHQWYDIGKNFNTVSQIKLIKEFKDKYGIKLSITRETSSHQYTVLTLTTDK